MKTLRNFSRLFIGLMFVFSGFVKAVDPMGSMFKFEDYFTAFGIEWLSPLALFFSILLSTSEFVIGFALLTNSFTRFFSWIAFAFMLFFTFLTFILALQNPVTDCGCFGDAIILTNWQTFYKNLIFMLPTLILFLSRNKFHGRWKASGAMFQVLLAILFSVGISLKSLLNEPLIDFRPYRIGQNITINFKPFLVGAPSAVFETLVVYEKDGVRKSFDLNNLPDTTWKWVETQNRQISAGYVPKIHNFHLLDLDGNSATEKILNSDQPVLMACVWDLSALSTESKTKLNQIGFRAFENNIQFVLVTSATPKEIEKFKYEYLPTYQLLTADPITLKTILRDNGGLVLMYKGTILKKWNHKKFDEPLNMTEYKLYMSAVNTGSPDPLNQTFWYLLFIASVALFFDWLAIWKKNRS